MAEATPVNFRDSGKARNWGVEGEGIHFLKLERTCRTRTLGSRCPVWLCFASSRERGLLRVPSHLPATGTPHSTQPTAGLLLLLDTGIHPGSVAPALGAAGIASSAWAPGLPRAHGAAKAGGHTAGAALAPPPVCAIGAVRRAGAGGLEKPSPALPRIGTPPRRLLGVTPPVPLPAIFGDGQWEGGGAATPVRPRRGVTHGTRVQSSAGRVRL